MLKLKQLLPVQAVAAYNPVLQLPTELQTIQLWYNWFLMSPGRWVSVKGPAFKGYLQSFEPAEQQATMEITIAHD